MEASRAKLSFYRQSPKKVRKVVDVIRGMRVEKAQAQLLLMSKRASDPIRKLLDSAIANAVNSEKNPVTIDRLFIKQITVDEGPTLRRYRPRAFGRASIIRKRTSHIKIVLGATKSKSTAEPKKAADKKPKKTTKKPAAKKPAAAKKETKKN